MTPARFWFIARFLGMTGLVFSSALLAMGTPPQKSTKSAPETNSNAVMLKADDLRATPAADSKVLARVEKDARVRLLATQAGWRQISSAGKTGWVRVLALSADANAGVEWSDLEALGKTPQGKVIAIAGTRGLDDETLKTAVYNASEIQLLHGYALSRGEAEQYAQAAGLQVRAMPYLDSPARAQRTGSDSPWKEN